MKNSVFIVILLLSFSLKAQERAVDYFVPPSVSDRYFYLSTSSSLSGDLADLPLGYTSRKYSYAPHYNEDGSVGFKFIHHDEDIFMVENHAYFVKFNGNSAQLYGYSDYLVDDDGFLIDVYNESYKAIENTVIWKVPNESYQTVDQTFYDNYSKTNITVTTSYKTFKVADYEKRLLQVEYNKNGSVRKEYYLKYYGLIAFQDYSGSIYVADMNPLIVFSKSQMDAMDESAQRNKAWKIYESVRDYVIPDSFFNYSSSVSKWYFNKLDTLSNLYSHMMIRNPDKIDAYRYLLSVKMQNLVAKVYDAGNKLDKTTHKSNVVMYTNDYLMLRPAPEYVPKAGLSTYITNVDQNYFELYWKMVTIHMKYIINDNTFDKDYKSYLIKPFILQTINAESNMDNVNKCILNSYVATYYNYIGNESKRYLYITKSVENYQFLSTADKDKNIDYMRTAMKNLSTLKPANEEDLNRAMDAVLNLKDYINAVKIGNNGYNTGIGVGLAFAMKYAEASYNDDINKDNLRNAMNLMKGKLSEMSSAQVTEYVKYCRAMSPEFDCSNAESELKKAQQREKNDLEKKQKEERKKNRTSGNNRLMNLAIMANPFAGLNISGNGALFKFMPVSASLRVGKVIYEFRYNKFLGADFKNRFVFGKLQENNGDDIAKWKNLKGQDYCFGINFVKNDFSGYKKSVTSIGGGVQGIYGQFSSDDETANATINNVPTNIILRPKIKRYEALVNFHFTTFSWKNHLAATMFYGFGLGLRDLEYGNYTFSQETLSDSSKTTFADRRFVQSNWSGPYFTFRAGFRFGFTIF